MGSMDDLISADVMRTLGRGLAGAGHVDTLAQLTLAAPRLTGRTLRRRVDLVRDVLLDTLPTSVAELDALLRATFADPTITGWMLWPLSEAVAERALDDGGTPAFDVGMDLLALLTPRLTSEFALRPMLRARLDRALAIAQTWTASADPHVRRLASEGTRSRLPWATRVPALLHRPEATRPIVAALRSDPAEYVRRSVANHLNDQSRDDPDYVVDLVAGWPHPLDRPTAALARHALRTLVKGAHPGALAELGFVDVDVDVTVAVHAPAVRLGGALEFTATVTNRTSNDARMAIDYVLHLRLANGGTSARVFKLANRAVPAGTTTTLHKAHSFRPITTRRYYPGEHALELQVNGRRSGRSSFELVQAAPVGDSHTLRRDGTSCT